MLIQLLFIGHGTFIGKYILLQVCPTGLNAAGPNAQPRYMYIHMCIQYNLSRVTTTMTDNLS